jgi:hypothetical protein
MLQESVYPLAGVAESRVQWVQVHIWSGEEIKRAPLQELVLIDVPLDFPTFHRSFLMLSLKVEQVNEK